MLNINNLSKFYPAFTSASEGIAYLYNVAVGNHAYINRINHVKALRDVNLSISPGERVGLIGRNGSGKTTLLNIIAGGNSPTDGEISLNGTLYHLSSDTVSFDSELSARENIRLFLQKHDFPESLIRSRMDDIEDFLELGEYFEQPVKRYSLGMRARTEFAAATSVDAALILIDEILGAGDIYWSEKCADRIQSYCDRGRSLLLVSHSMGQILRYCERVVWLDKGMIVMDGEAHEVVRRYETYIEKLTWLVDDIEDKTLGTNSEAVSTVDDVLEDSGQHVLRWPGRGNIIFNGIWINNEALKEFVIDRREAMKIEFAIKMVHPGDYPLRYLITFWTLTGKRHAVIENEVHEYSRAKDKCRVSVQTEGNIISPGIYILSFTAFVLGRSGSTAIEFDSRMDMISKSIKLVVNDSSVASQASRPCFSMHFEPLPGLPNMLPSNASQY